MRKFFKKLDRFFFQALLRVELVTFILTKARFFYFVYIRGKIRVFEDEKSVIANDYSTRMLKRGVTSFRPLKFIRPLSVIEAVNKEGATLSLGCRFETELLLLQGYGFAKKGIRGMDMISYSPRIDLGNMHKMPYADSSFDTVTMGWLISYSDTPEVAAKEVVRVLKPGGFVAMSVAYYPPDRIKHALATGEYVANPATRIQTPDGLLKLFEPNVDQVYFRHLPPLSKEGACTVIFSIKK